MADHLESAHILIVDDDPSFLKLLTRLLARKGGYVVEAVAGLAEADKMVIDQPPDLLLIDKNLKDGSGLDIIRRIHEQDLDVAVIVMSGFGTLPSAVEAMRLGVADYFIKPFDNFDEVTERVRKVLEVHLLKRSNRQMIEELKQQNEYLKSLVVKDQLTGLFNHAYFQDCLQRELSWARRHGKSLSLLLLDVDDFKGVNRELGHRFGDELLRQLSYLISQSSRSSDMQFSLRKEQIAARYGGDRFAVILPGTSKEGAANLAERLRGLVENHDFCREKEGHRTISVGVASYSDDGEDREQLIHAANVALYCAKENGRNRIIAYTPELGWCVDSLNKIADSNYFKKIVALEQSIAEETFHFVYQPIVETENGTIRAYEALCRPDHAIFSGPADVFTTAETVGRVKQLGQVLRKLALTHIALLPEPILLSVNLHPQELNDEELLASDSPLVPWAKRIILEITEVEAIMDFKRMANMVARLRERGFRIAVDDLGSGYAGLQSLASLRPDYVKLDMDLVRDIDRKPRTARLVKHLCEFAEGEGMEVIAEGVENQMECDIVKSLGCKLFQGYLFSKPGPPFPTTIQNIEICSARALP